MVVDSVRGEEDEIRTYVARAQPRKRRRLNFHELCRISGYIEFPEFHGVERWCYEVGSDARRTLCWKRIRPRQSETQELGYVWIQEVREVEETRRKQSGGRKSRNGWGKGEREKGMRGMQRNSEVGER